MFAIQMFVTYHEMRQPNNEWSIFSGTLPEGDKASGMYQEGRMNISVSSFGGTIFGMNAMNGVGDMKIGMIDMIFDTTMARSPPHPDQTLRGQIRRRSIQATPCGARGSGSTSS